VNYRDVPYAARERVQRTLVTNPTLTVEQVAARSSVELDAVLAVLGGPGANVETEVSG
jgi:hypothetical protein